LERRFRVWRGLEARSWKVAKYLLVAAEGLVQFQRAARDAAI